MTGLEFRQAVGGLKQTPDPTDKKGKKMIDSVADMKTFRDIK
jgi:hypothetical protein